MRLEYKQERIYFFADKYITFENARRMVLAYAPHIVKKYVIKSEWERGKIRVYVDWRAVFYRQDVKILLLKSITKPK